MAWSHRLQLLAAVLCALATAAHCSSFVFFCLGTVTHFPPVTRLLKHLAERNHSVTIVTDESFAPSMNRLGVLEGGLELTYFANRSQDLYDLYEQMNEELTPQGKDKELMKRFLNDVVSTAYERNVHFTLDYLRDKAPDMVICDMFVDVCIDAAHHLGLNFAVSLPTTLIMPGVADAPYTVNFMLGLSAPTTAQLSLWQRFTAAYLLPFGMLYGVLGAVAKINRARVAAGLPPSYDPPHAKWHSSLKLINGFWGLEVARPVDPLVWLYGPSMPSSYRPLERESQGWLEQLAAQGGHRTAAVMYIAFGTGAAMAPQTVQAVLDGVAQLVAARVLDGAVWAVRGSQRALLPATPPAHLLAVDWVAQRALLAHPACRVFMSHGGGASVSEALLAGKPILVLPFQGEQAANGARLQAAGVAVLLDRTSVTADKVAAAAQQLLPEPGARPSASTAASLARLQALAEMNQRHSLERTVDILEYGASYGWADLTPPDRQMPAWQAGNWDLQAAVWGTVGGVLVGALWCCGCCSSRHRPKSKEE